MTDKNLDEKLEEKLTQAYDTMMKRVELILNNAEHKVMPSINDTIEKAKQQALHLKELTQEEAERLGDYLIRDIHDAAHHMEHTGEQLSRWLRFDVELIEARVLELFATVADKTRLELTAIATQANIESNYHTGEITGIGTLVCQHCGGMMNFTKTSRIPPCPKCHKTHFTRTIKD